MPSSSKDACVVLELEGPEKMGLSVPGSWEQGRHMDTWGKGVR